MTVAERDELLDAVERLERHTERPLAGPATVDPLGVLYALADLVARAGRIWLTDRAAPPP